MKEKGELSSLGVLNDNAIKRKLAANQSQLLTENSIGDLAEGSMAGFQKSELGTGG